MADVLFLLKTNFMSSKCVFLDRDGVLNREIGDYAWRLDHFEVNPGVAEALKILKDHGYLLIVVTNQAGISKGLFKEEDVLTCHDYLQESCGNLIDDIYYCPYHPSVTESLLRKPGSLMFEKAIAKYKIEASSSWMVGDAERDIVPAKKLHLKTIQVGEGLMGSLADFTVKDLLGAARLIVAKS
jgi:D-glycero-D-manno-heptose 1,7-bisphosphate phosphatase